LVRSYSGGEWAGDWYEHYERARFFLERYPLGQKLISVYLLPARPPLDTARNLFPKLYPRLAEIIQLNSSSSLMATPSERDFKSPIAPEIERYFGQAEAPARERVALYRLAWDAAGSSFAGRQVLYERFFFGDPVRMARQFT